MEGPERRVAVVGSGDRAAGLRDAVRESDGRLVDPAGPEDETTGGVDAVVAVGDDAIRESLVDGPSAPVVLVGERRLALPPEDAAARVRRLLDAPVRGDGDAVDPFDRVEQGDGGVQRVTHPVLAVDAGTGPVRRAVFDVALVTEEPARISEFAAEFPEGRMEPFRADGVVLATPLGSDGYANAAGGALVEPGGGLSVVPIAPFSTRTDEWIAAERATISVERETEPVAIVIDGTTGGVVDPDRPIEIETVDSVDVLVPESIGTSRARRSETL